MLGTENSDVPVVTLSAKDDKKLLRKGMKDLNIGMNVKQKVRI